jgi:transposase
MTLTWHGLVQADEVVNLGPLALIHPLLDKLDVRGIMDRHMPADPQQEFSHGQVLSLLLAARLAQPTALINIADWAEKTGADILWNIPADKLNDDRLGRALDQFFLHRHSILASVTAQALHLTDLSLERLHFDTTHLLFHGTYEDSQPRPPTRLADLKGNEHLPAAHICHGYLSRQRMIQVGVSAVVDEMGAVPVFNQPLDGSCTGQPGIRQQFELLQQHLPLADHLLMVSDRGTFSAAYVKDLKRHGYHVLCSVAMDDFLSVYDAYADDLQWQTASFLSIEQRRRRQANSALPHEHYRLAVHEHVLSERITGDLIPCRLIFVYSTVREKGVRERRQKNIAKIQSGLEAIAAKLERGSVRSTPETVSKEVLRLFGRRGAARYFRWQILTLSAEERAALPPPSPGRRRPLYRLVYSFDADAAQADERYDGLSILLTTAPLTRSADELFTIFKQQNFIELLHHQWKTPLAVRPVFLKSPQRVEALVCLLQLALQAYQVLERRYRQTLPEDASVGERRTTAETLLRQFRAYGLIVVQQPLGRVVRATRLTSRQRQILNQLSFQTPAQTLARILHPVPSG